MKTWNETSLGLESLSSGLIFHLLTDKNEIKTPWADRKNDTYDKPIPRYTGTNGINSGEVY